MKAQHKPSTTNNSELDLNTLRQEIDVIDTQLCELLEKRSRVVDLVAHYKIKHNLPVYQPEREKLVLEHKATLATTYNLDPEFLKELFMLIMKSSRKKQEHIIKHQ